MKTSTFLSTAAAATAFFANSAIAQGVPSIVIKGSKFFYENNGTQFFMKGVAYQRKFSRHELIRCMLTAL
jgi:1,3-beta-glucanosyltransferase GAS1